MSAIIPIDLKLIDDSFQSDLKKIQEKEKEIASFEITPNLNASEINKRLSDIKISLKQLESSKLKIEAEDKTSPKLKEIEKQEQKLRKELKSLQLQVNTTKAEGNITGFFSRVKSGIQGIGGLFNKITAGLGQFGLAAAGVQQISAIFQSAINPLKNFETGLANISTLLDETSSVSVEQLSEEILKLGQEIPTDSITELTDAYYQAISAGIDAAKATEFVGLAGKAAIAGLSDTETAVDALTTVLNSYGKENISNQQISDVLFNTIKLGKTDFNQLASSLNIVANTAASAGVPFNEVGDAVAKLTAQGVPTSVAMTQIRQGILASQQVLGDAAFEGRTLGETFEVISNRANGSTVGVKKLVGTIEATSAIMGLTKESTLGLSKGFEDINASAGASATAFEKQSQTISNQLKSIGGNIEQITIKIGQALMPIIKNILSFVNDVTGAFLNFGAVIKENSHIVKGLIAGISALAVGFGILKFETLSSIASAKAKIIIDKIQLITTKALAIATKIFYAILRANPIGLIITAVSILIGFFVTWISKTYDLNKVWELLKNTFSNVISILKSIGSIILQVLITPFKTLIGVVKSVIEYFTGFGNLLKAIFTGDFSAIPGIIKNSFSNIKDNLTKPFTDAKNNIVKEGKNIVNEFGEIKDKFSKADLKIKTKVDEPKNTKSAIDATQKDIDKQKVTIKPEIELSKEQLKKIDNLNKAVVDAEIKSYKLKAEQVLSEEQTLQQKIFSLKQAENNNILAIELEKQEKIKEIKQRFSGEGISQEKLQFVIDVETQEYDTKIKNISEQTKLEIQKTNEEIIKANQDKVAKLSSVNEEIIEQELALLENNEVISQQRLELKKELINNEIEEERKKYELNLEFQLNQGEIDLQEFEKKKELFEKELELKKEFLEEQVELDLIEQERKQLEIESEDLARETKLQKEVDYYNSILFQKNLTASQELEIEKRKTIADAKLKEEQLKNSADFFGNLSAIAGAFAGESRAAFEIQKRLAQAEAIINTYAAATKAYNTFASIPPLAIAAAGAAIATGLQNVRQIEKTKFAKGGILEGKSHSQGGIQLFNPGGSYFGEAEGGEPILTKGVSKDKRLLSLASEINVLGGGKPIFSRGGISKPTNLRFYQSGGVIDAQTKVNQINADNLQNLIKSEIRNSIKEIAINVSQPVILENVMDWQEFLVTQEEKQILYSGIS